MSPCPPGMNINEHQHPSTAATIWRDLQILQAPTVWPGSTHMPFRSPLYKNTSVPAAAHSMNPQPYQRFTIRKTATKKHGSAIHQGLHLPKNHGQHMATIWKELKESNKTWIEHGWTMMNVIQIEYKLSAEKEQANATWRTTTSALLGLKNFTVPVLTLTQTIQRLIMIDNDWS